jgi:tetratricopeptide (TPR) repeat protein
MRALLISIVLTIAALTPGRVYAQDSLEAAKTLYASASYDEALSALEKVDSDAQRLEADQYRAFCLIALERPADAQRAIAAVVNANPAYAPDPAEVSPRIRDAFLKVRRDLLPDLSRRLYLDARSAFDRKDREAAVAAFRTVVSVIDSAAPVEGSIAELRVLAQGFLELSEALPAKEPTRAEPQPSGTATASKPAAPVVTPPVAVKQSLPLWNPPDGPGRFREYAGAVHVKIGADGKVQSADIIRSIYPAYNQILLRAAMGWEYEPARRDGVAIASEKTVEVRLSPPK